MGGYRTNTGENLRREWQIPACQVRYREDGKWFMPLEEFPGALADAAGYVLFSTQEAYQSCRHLRIGARVNVSDGISSIPGYVRFEQHIERSTHQAEIAPQQSAESAAAGCAALILIPVALYLGYWAITSVVGWTYWAAGSFDRSAANWPSETWWQIGIALYVIVPTVAIGAWNKSLAAAFASFAVLITTIVVPASIYLIVIWILSWSMTTWMALILGSITLAAGWWVCWAIATLLRNEKGD